MNPGAIGFFGIALGFVVCVAGSSGAATVIALLSVGLLAYALATGKTKFLG